MLAKRQAYGTVAWESEGWKPEKGMGRMDVRGSQKINKQERRPENTTGNTTDIFSNCKLRERYASEPSDLSIVMQLW